MKTVPGLKQLNRVFPSVLLALVAASFAFGQGRNPMILIPGLTGSELRDRKTGEKVWIKALKSKNSDDIRLPISTDLAAMTDALVPGDIIRKVEIAGVSVRDIYGGFVKRMRSAGYHEEKWDAVTDKSVDNALFVFPYDWRQDNVANARLLVRRMDALKARLKRPELKFDLVAHSMGGLISRYAAMYGDAELPKAGSMPTWAGAGDIDRVVLLGVPNEGSISALAALLEGYTFSGIRIDLPFVQDSSRFTIFTIPSTFQLLPAPGTLKVFDDRLEPVDIDLYDPKTWKKYGWNPIDDDGFPDTFSLSERRIAQPYFEAMLARAKRFHEALAAGNDKPAGVTFFTVGSDCKPAPDAVIVYRDALTSRWKTLTRPKGFTRSDGQRISDEELRKLMMATGDGVVTVRSVEAKTQSGLLKTSSALTSPGKYFCEEHNRLAADDDIEDYIIQLLRGAARTTRTVAAKTDQE